MTTRRLRTTSVGSAMKTGELILPEKETLLLWYLKVYLHIDRAFQSESCNYISNICDKNVATQNLVFLSCWCRKKRLQMHFNKVRCHKTGCNTHRWRAVVSSLHSYKIILTYLTTYLLIYLLTYSLHGAGSFLSS